MIAPLLFINSCWPIMPSKICWGDCSRVGCRVGCTDRYCNRYLFVHYEYDPIGIDQCIPEPGGRKLSDDDEWDMVHLG